MKYTRLWCSRLLLVTVTGLLLTACTSQGSETWTPLPREQVSERPPQPTPEPVTIRFAIGDWQRDAYKTLAEAFMEANPDVYIQFVSYDELLGPIDRTKGLDQIQWPDVPKVADVFPINLPMADDVVATRRVRDLTPFIEADADFHPEDFYPGALDGYPGPSGMWAIPTTLDVYVVVYHKGVFDAAGVAYPEPGWTWEDLISKARALTEHNEDKVTRWGFALNTLSPITMIGSRAGVSLFDYTSNPPMPRFDQPEVVQAVEWYTDLQAEAVVTYPVSIDNPQRLYDETVAAMWTDTLQWWNLFSSRADIGIAPLPADTRGLATIYPMEALAMSAGTRHPDAAWRWIEFLTHQKISSIFFPNALPARRSVAENTGYWESLDAETATVLQYAVQHDYHPSDVNIWGGSSALLTALDAILSGEKTIEDALADANVQAIELMRKEQERLARITPVPPFTVGEGETSRTPEDLTTITFIPGTDPSDQQRYRTLASRFHQTHPDVAVEIILPPTLLGPASLSNLAHAADCFLASPDLRRPQDEEAVLSLRPFLDADPSFPADDFYPAALPPFTWRGDLRALPAELTPYVVEYHKDLFDAAGLDYPTPTWTYDDFLTLARALTSGEGENAQYGFLPEPFSDYALPLILERWGADLLDETQNPPALTFDSPATVAALHRYADLATVHRVQPSSAVDLAHADGTALTEWESLIRSGRAAMWMLSSSWSAYLHSGQPEDVGVVPLPAGGGSSGYVQAKGYFISAQARAPQVCWEWITFLSTQPDAVEGLPARKSVAESEAYRRQVGEERADAYLASVTDVNSHSFTLTAARHPWLHGVEFWLFRAYTQAVNGETSVEAALADAQVLADAYRACVISRDALYDQEKWGACLREVDPTLPPSLFGAE
ncbi:MAG: extracellular solute-binding protein [Anaerolineae bacterium]|nr:extracellular solute-binding protein [Anaerolineae bacterium]